MDAGGGGGNPLDVGALLPAFPSPTVTTVRGCCLKAETIPSASRGVLNLLRLPAGATVGKQLLEFLLEIGVADPEVQLAGYVCALYLQFFLLCLDSGLLAADSERDDLLEVGQVLGGGDDADRLVVRKDDASFCGPWHVALDPERDGAGHLSERDRARGVRPRQQRNRRDGEAALGLHHEVDEFRSRVDPVLSRFRRGPGDHDIARMSLDHPLEGLDHSIVRQDDEDVRIHRDGESRDRCGRDLAALARPGAGERRAADLTAGLLTVDTAVVRPSQDERADTTLGWMK